MKNEKLAKLDAILKEQENKKADAIPYLNKQALIIQRIDKNIEYYKNKISNLEKNKQDELEKMQELFDSVTIASHSINDYFISFSYSRKMTINDVPKFLQWLKKNCQPHEVLEFFTDAIKSTELKKFVNKQCDKQRLNGEMKPFVDGIDLGDINFRRLTTYYKEKK